MRRGGRGRIRKSTHFALYRHWLVATLSVSLFVLSSSFRSSLPSPPYFRRHHRRKDSTAGASERSDGVMGREKGDHGESNSALSPWLRDYRRGTEFEVYSLQLLVHEASPLRGATFGRCVCVQILLFFCEGKCIAPGGGGVYAAVQQ